jgi:hypothetical protein
LQMKTGRGARARTYRGASRSLRWGTFRRDGLRSREPEMSLAIGSRAYDGTRVSANALSFRSMAACASCDALLRQHRATVSGGNSKPGSTWFGRTVPER